MKTQFFFILLIGAIAFGCNEPEATTEEQQEVSNEGSSEACECLEYLKSGSDPEKAKACKERMKADEAFKKAVSECKAKALTNGGQLNVSKEESIKAKVPQTGLCSFDVDKSKVTWLGSKITGDKHTGTVTLKEGFISFNDGAVAKGAITLDMTTLDNTDLEDEEDKAKLLRHLKSDDFFGVANHPEASFEIKDIKMNGAQAILVGDLTVKGETHEEKVKAVIAQSGDNNVVVTGTLIFDRAKYDVRYGSGQFFDDLGDNLIKDDVVIKFQLKGALS